MAALLTSLGISIHAPREGGDGLITRRSKRLKLFQSTPPARGATIIAIGVPKLFYISIHAPREGGDLVAVVNAYGDTISIHAPREGGDGTAGLRHPTRRHFNPRPPRGGRREDWREAPWDHHFNPRPPRGGRHPSSWPGIKPP